MTRGLTRVGCWAALVCAAAIAPAATAATENATPARAQAHVESSWPVGGRLLFDVLRCKGGIKLGEARHAWQHDGERYHMTLNLETTGLAGLLYSFQYEQRSEGRLRQGVLMPDRFDVAQSRRAPEQSVFDWTRGQVSVVRKGETRVHPIRPGDQDVLSVWHLFALANGRPIPQALLLVSNRRATPTTIEALQAESVQVPAGRFETRRFAVRASTGKLNIDLWVADSQHGVPVRLVMTDDKGQVLDLQLRSIEFAAP